MSIFQSLGEEHALILQIVGRLERATSGANPVSAKKESRGMLLVLFKALEAHENLEHLVFDEEAEPPAGPQREALAHVESQHQALWKLREEAAGLLQSHPHEDSATMRALIRRLTHLLRAHFENEERVLWPAFHAAAGRSRLSRLDRVARAQVRVMRKELDSYLIAVATYLT